MADGTITLVTGGARSGKSALAERLAARHGLPRIYIATAQPWDAEMADRIARHRLSRGDGWTTIEEPLALTEALLRSNGQGVRLVDCLTLWLSNAMADADADAGDPDLGGLTATLGRMRSPVVLVTNELGQGIVPDNALARRFRDRHGWMNQAVAAVADQVWISISGMPLRLKPMKDDPDETL